MKKTTQTFGLFRAMACAATIMASVFMVTGIASADNSTKGGMSVSAGLGFGLFVYNPGSRAEFRFPTAEFNYHFSHRSDGFNLGARQELWFTRGEVTGASLGRFGYDFAILV